MFFYKSPVFEKKKILRIEMLEQLRDYPKNFIGLCLKSMSDGILTGCEVSWEEGELIIQPGMVCWEGKLYMMEELERIPCHPTGKKTYVNVVFSAESREGTFVTGMGQIQMRDTPAVPSIEMELCRFQLQMGAKLRYYYEGFQDYSTQYNTVNRIHTPYSGYKEPMMWPQMMEQLSKEILAKNPQSTMDCIFAMQILGNNGFCSRDLVETYVNSKLQKDKENYDNKELYEKLLTVLTQVNSERSSGVNKRSNRSVLLM